MADFLSITKLVAFNVKGFVSSSKPLNNLTTGDTICVSFDGQLGKKEFDLIVSKEVFFKKGERINWPEFNGATIEAKHKQTGKLWRIEINNFDIDQVTVAVAKYIPSEAIYCNMFSLLCRLND